MSGAWGRYKVCKNITRREGGQALQKSDSRILFMMTCARNLVCKLVARSHFSFLSSSWTRTPHLNGGEQQRKAFEVDG